MKQQTELIIQLVVGILLLTRPSVLVDMANTLLGRLVLLLAVVGAAMQSTLTGVLVAMLFIVLSETVFEGMENKTDAAKKDSENVEKKSEKLEKDDAYLLKFRKRHCIEKNGKLLFVDNNKNVVSLDQIKKMYPNIKFDDAACSNPCDEKCDLVITSYDEQMTTEEQLRPKESSSKKVKRKKDAVQTGVMTKGQ
tara:strand:- start:686 stop:1267 length:582 start_codon:yes stop_codon:yes gene_type:complete